MVQIGKKINVLGKCKTCDQKIGATVTAIGEKGRSGDWKGTGTCPKCGNRVALEKKNIKF